MECSAFVHEESSAIAGDLAQRAYADRKNAIWDITMSSMKSAERRVSDLRAAGYSDISGVFVDIPAEKSVERALGRYPRRHRSRHPGDSRPSAAFRSVAWLLTLQSPI